MHNIRNISRHKKTRNVYLSRVSKETQKEQKSMYHYSEENATAGLLGSRMNFHPSRVYWTISFLTFNRVDNTNYGNKPVQFKLFIMQAVLSCSFRPFCLPTCHCITVFFDIVDQPVRHIMPQRIALARSFKFSCTPICRFLPLIPPCFCALWWTSALHRFCLLACSEVRTRVLDLTTGRRNGCDDEREADSRVRDFERERAKTRTCQD